ncbi:YjcZ family sporulation protein [Thomasclavelia cocleata]|nr:YjcZ family sporulation protein [Thomasclavelia cocleata]MCI9631372.1 YjcZ family sporulation protein [Thomasclavelia cocleata]NDO42046.1 YjcZ family sporulation protein [Thomasclavelia cocleata]PJN80869.1 YjcZ family sporulation protein [Thomasclavelia cocleata]
MSVSIVYKKEAITMACQDNSFTLVLVLFILLVIICNMC